MRTKVASEREIEREGNFYRLLLTVTRYKVRANAWDAGASHCLTRELA